MTDSLNKLAYFCNEVHNGTSYSKYILFLDGREVLNAFASADEIDHPIYISKPFEDIGTMIKTKGRAQMDPENGHIDGLSMQGCVYKYMGWLLADLYVPKGN
jgi:hypothetical protein